MRFSELLTRFREQSDLNKAQLAKRLRVSDGYVRNLESGRQRPPTFARIQQIIDVLSLSPKEAAQLKEAAALERVHPEDKHLIERSGEVEVRNTEIPIVSSVGATDNLGRTSFTAYEPPYRTILFKDCKALVVDSNSMAPIAYKGQKIIYCESEGVHNGDLVFIKLKDGSQLFKRYYKNHKNITLQSINPVESYEPIIIEEKEIEFCYKVIAVKF